MISLYVIQGNDQGRRFELHETTLTIGRDPVNHVPLHDQEVSRRHARIEFRDQDYHLLDEGSVNGIFVNGKRIKDHLLRNADQILLGQTLLLFASRASSEDPKDLSEMPSDLALPPDDPRADHRLVDNHRIIQSVSPSADDVLFDPPLRTGSNNESSWSDAHLTMMYHTTLVTSQTLDIGILLHRILDLIFEWVAIDRGSIMLFDPETCQLIPQATRLSQEKPDRPTRRPEKLSINKSIVSYVLKRREGVLTNDAQNDARWDMKECGVREIICVPMMGRYGLVGIIYIDTFQRKAALPTDPADEMGSTTLTRAYAHDLSRGPSGQAPPRLRSDHLRLMVAIAHQAALAVEDTRYYKGMIQGERLAAVGQTVTTLSHHAKNILQGISGGSHLIQLGLDRHDEEMIRKGWNIVEKNQSRISQLILDMLTFSKEREPAYEFGDIKKTIVDIVDLMRAHADEMDVDIHFTEQTEIPKFFFDLEQIHRAITNIVINGIEAARPKSERNDSPPGVSPQGILQITIDFDPKRSLVLIDVDDNGPGIPKSLRATLFRPFYSEKKGRGTGLGLSVAYKVIEEHGGTIRITESSLGGACFQINLPFKQSPDHAEDRSEDHLEFSSLNF